ncbi:hypothetical protein [Thermotoga sp. KOL6]|uniref:hypothetical protein n=1 Tax=Thermotoga sp. KOL6 TaxID=126741 RepID=UPI000C760848|nr:hypothetical protein [Thermotoga sp. KOL6]PLV60380.1 hypothetical protein AS005_03635 [Thermotoga sp. KOL6]
MRILLKLSKIENELVNVLESLEEGYEIVVDKSIFEDLKRRVPNVSLYKNLQDFDLLYMDWEKIPSSKRETDILSIVDINKINLFFETIKNYREKLVVTTLDNLKTALSEIEQTGDISLQTRRRLVLKELARFLSILSRLLEDLSDLFFIKEWKALVLKKVSEQGAESIVNLFPVEAPEKFVLDISLAVHFIRYLPKNACVLIRDQKVIYASSEGNLPDLKGGVLGYKGTFHEKKKFDFIVAEDFVNGVEGIRLDDVESQEDGLVLFGISGLSREPIPTDDFTEALALHPVFNCCAITKEGRLIAHLVELQSEKIFMKLEQIDLSGTRVAFNFSIEESLATEIKKKGAERVSWIDSRKTWRRY